MNNENDLISSNFMIHGGLFISALACRGLHPVTSVMQWKNSYKGQTTRNPGFDHPTKGMCPLFKPKVGVTVHVIVTISLRINYVSEQELDQLVTGQVWTS